MTATTKEIVEFVGGALRWLLNVGVVVMLFFGVAIMLGILKSSFPDRIDEWEGTLRDLIPSYGGHLNSNPDAAQQTLAETANVLALKA